MAQKIKLKNEKPLADFNPLVSIIIPVYNGSEYVEEAIDSALNQSYKNIEILVVNDGSNDNNKTEKIVKKYGDKVRYFSKKNGGVSSALNLAIENMVGEYFSWLSHDDRYYYNKIEAQINYLKNNYSEKTIVYSDYDLMDLKSRVFSTAKKDSKMLNSKQEYSVLRGAINGITLLIPKKAFLEVGMFDEALRCTQDYDLWYKMLDKYDFIHMPMVLATTRLHQQQQSNVNPLVQLEGNSFWTDAIEKISAERKIELEGNIYTYYVESLKFLETTNYTETISFLKNKIEELKKIAEKDSEKIKVSVIIPFYNRVEILKRSIDSVLSQTHSNIEIILINDGSTDDCSELKKYIKSINNIKYYEYAENKGVSHARNYGISLATGDYIALLDSDDEFIAEKIEIQLIEMVASQSKISHTSYFRNDGKTTKKIETGKLSGDIIQEIIFSCPIATPTIMFERNYFLTKKLKYNEKYTIGEDVCLYLDMLKETKMQGINIPLTIVNTSTESAAFNIDKQIIGLKQIITHILNDQDLRQYDTEIAKLGFSYVQLVQQKYTQDQIIISECQKCLSREKSVLGKIKRIFRKFRSFIRIMRSEGFSGVYNRLLKKGD